MTKDIIYIDVEDDITAIIGKIKASREKIIALVPPKRIGSLQSAVNLRLLNRMAQQGHKRLVLITNNQALIALAAAAKIPVAKNLQSKPELAEIAALEVDDGEDVIDGAQLPVGELARTADKQADETASMEDKLDDIDIDNDTPTDPAKSTRPTPAVAVVKSADARSKIKVPDFSRFRKQLFFGGIGGAALISFLVWTIWFAPSAKVVITAKTSPAPVSLAVKLGGSAPTDVSKGTIQTLTKQVKKDISVDFTATGKKKLGDKATGTLTLSNSNSSEPINVPAGSIFTSSDYDFVTKTAVDVPGAAVVNGSIVPGSIEVDAEAADVGAEYNLAAASYLSSVNGIAAEGSQMSGGSSHEATVVTASDVQKANQALNALTNDDTKKQLTDQFTNGETVIPESFAAVYVAAVPKPAVGEEVTDGKAKLTSAVTFTITAIAKSELETYLKDSISKQIDNTNTERIYDDGIDKVALSGYQKTAQSATVNIATTGQIGPNIDPTQVKEQVKGLHYGDVQTLLGRINGVSSVDTKFSYFWVNTVPSDTSKISVEFVLQNG